MALADRKGQMHNPLDKLLAAVPPGSAAATVINEVRARQNHPLKLALTGLAADNFKPTPAFLDPDNAGSVGYSKVLAGLLKNQRITPQDVYQAAAPVGFNLEMLTAHGAPPPPGYRSWRKYQEDMNRQAIAKQAATPANGQAFTPAERAHGAATTIWQAGTRGTTATRSAKPAFIGYGVMDNRVSKILLCGQGDLDVVNYESGGLICTRLPGGLDALAQKIWEESAPLSQRDQTKPGWFNGYVFVAHMDHEVYTKPDLQSRRELALKAEDQTGDLTLVRFSQGTYRISPNQQELTLADFLSLPLDMSSQGALHVSDGTGRLVKPIKLVAVLNTPNLAMTEPDPYLEDQHLSIGTHNLGVRRLVRTLKLFMNDAFEKNQGKMDDRMMVYDVPYST